MGSIITLAVGRLEIDWGKNHGYRDHSAIFQETDLAKTPYTYEDEEAEERECLSKPLSEVIKRLDILGYTEAYAEAEFEHFAKFNDFDRAKFSFSQLKQAIETVDVTSISTDYNNDNSPGDFFRKEIFERIGLDEIVDDEHYVKFEANLAMENLSAYSILRLLHHNPTAQNLPVVWYFSDLEQGGWAKRSDFIKIPDQNNRFLIVTEGSSDASIIRKGFEILRPTVADFFDYIDMKEGYPFSGHGNLQNFTKGLASIKVMNNIISIFDNDAAGVLSYNKTSSLKLPENIRVLKLPDLPEFESFDTLGPTGSQKCNINGKAVAIECFLDLGDTPIVRWSSFDKELDAYQGELINKTDYAKRFYKLTSLETDYDFSKLEKALDLIIQTCADMREQHQLQTLSSFFEDD